MKPQDIAQWTHHEMETIFHSVARYTKFVHSTKAVLSVLVFVLVGLVMFYLMTKNEDAGIRVAFTSVSKGAASPTQMQGAKFHGLDKSNQPFNVIAVTATQKDDNTLLLDKVSGDISLKSGAWLSMSANNGIFTMKERLLDLTGNVEMMNDDGYEFRSEIMHVDIGKKMASTNQNVKGQGPLGTLQATGAVVDGNNAVITFTGPVLVTMYPHQQGDAK
jgi:lipopolysaccharide export system protein LptC